MAKMRDAFRLVRDERQEAAPPVPPPDAPPVLADDAEMPFIEVGPRRLMEASPDVLACPGPVRPLVHAAAPLQRPHGGQVQFRTLPAARVTKFAPELVAYHTPDEVAGQQYGELLTALQHSVRQRFTAETRVFLFTGVRPGVRTTTVVLNLAITAAGRNQQVVVIDANLRQPAVAGRLGMEPHPGLAEVLTGSLPLTSAIRPTAQDGLSVLTAGAPAGLWVEPEALRDVLARVAERADVVFVDGPSWDGRAGVLALAQASEVTFLVVPASEADTPPASALIESLPAQGIALGGSVLTVT